MHRDESEIFKILPFYDIYIEKPKVKKLTNVQLLKELPFYDELNTVRNKAVHKVRTQRRGEGGSKLKRTSIVLVTSFFC